MTKYTLQTIFQKISTGTRISKIFFVALCFANLIIIIYVNPIYNNQTEEENRAQEVYDPDYSSNVLNDPKTILLWTAKHVEPFNYIGLGRTGFIRAKCKFTNCIVSAYSYKFRGDITSYDAIAFNGQNIRFNVPFNFPLQRLPHQKYIFFNVEPEPYQPVCFPWYDGFFNWTCSYKLDSDIVYPYIHIRDLNGVSVGPKTDMNWIENMTEIDEKFKEKLLSKKKAAAWFVSHCFTISEREHYVQSLQKALEPYRLTVDVYGYCGSLVCAKKNATRCFAMVAEDYYFYLAFENSISEDYVTEKLLTALNNDAVPIVYGGANYSRFLPPGTYIDARAHDPHSLAAIMADVISNRTKYHDFFRWRQHYTYSESENVEDVCNVCAALNDRNKMMPSVRVNLRSWWNPRWEESLLSAIFPISLLPLPPSMIRTIERLDQWESNIRKYNHTSVS